MIFSVDRVPNFSIREFIFKWYCEALAENGLKYGSSLFPMKVIKYGAFQANTTFHLCTARLGSFSRSLFPSLITYL